MAMEYGASRDRIKLFTVGLTQCSRPWTLWNGSFALLTTSGAESKSRSQG
jgi:hypothetical protein